MFSLTFQPTKYYRRFQYHNCLHGAQSLTKLIITQLRVIKECNLKSLPLDPILCKINLANNPHLNNVRYILILSSNLCLGLSNGLFPSGFPTKRLHTLLISPTRPIGILRSSHTPR
jgi:hypothetical protein